MGKKQEEDAREGQLEAPLPPPKTRARKGDESVLTF